MKCVLFFTYKDLVVNKAVVFSDSGVSESHYWQWL